MSSELKKVSVGLTFIGSIVIFLLFGACVLVFWPRSKEQTLDEKRAQTRADKLSILNKDSHEKLSAYAWANKDKGVVQLPIDRAMDLVANELAAKPVKASSVKVENPYPYGLQQPVAPAAPAPATTGTGAPAAAPSPAASGTGTPAAPAATGTESPQPPAPAAAPAK